MFDFSGSEESFVERQKRLIEKVAKAFEGKGLNVEYSGRYAYKENNVYRIDVKGLKSVDVCLRVNVTGFVWEATICFLVTEHAKESRNSEVWERICKKFPCPCGKGQECGIQDYDNPECIENLPIINGIVEYVCALDEWYRMITESPIPKKAAAAYDTNIEIAKHTLETMMGLADKAFFRKVDNLLAGR